MENAKQKGVSYFMDSISGICYDKFVVEKCHGQWEAAVHDRT